MTGRYPSEVVRVVCAQLTPFIAMFGLYVIAHGHYGPGGGFAGGVALAVAAILPRLVLDEELAYANVPEVAGPIAGGLGFLAFVVVGLVPLLAGGAFLDYGAIELAGVEAARMRYLGILVVEVAVGIAVFGALLLLYDLLAGRVR